jgi:cysteine desulfurase
MPAYFDHNATTPPHPEVVRLIPQWLNAWGNPSSVHQTGREPKRLLRESREQIAKFLNVNPLELIFTSGGSESNALALQGTFNAIRKKDPARKKVVISSVEHPAVRETAFRLIEHGAEVVQIPVDRGGRLNMDIAGNMIDSSTAIVSVMLANNETGSILPLGELVQMAHARGAIVHSDCVQALGKIPLDLVTLGVDLASFSAHKFYALRGCGVLYQRKGTPLESQILGGGQERFRRAGTENVLAYASLGLVCAMADEAHFQRMREMASLRDLFEKLILSEVANARVTGADVPRLPNTSNVVIPGVDGETMLMGLDLRGFSVSTGSACSSGSSEPSKTLLAMGLSRIEADSSLRVSLGTNTTEKDVRELVEAIKAVVGRVKVVHQVEVTHGA